jgi:membrane fusion protein, multidrug efflux system
MNHVTSTMLTKTLSATALLAAALGMAACSGTHDTSANESGAPVEVPVQIARLEPAVQPFEAGGVVRARTTATLVSRIFADVNQVLVKPGDRVRAGQVLIRLDARDLQAQRAGAEASAAAADQGVKAAMTNRDAALAGLALATATHKRVAELRAKNSATPNELDQAVSGLREAESRAAGAEAVIRQAEEGAKAARAGLRAATVGASYAEITAPFDAVVAEKKVEVGNMATPGAPLMVVEDVRAFRLEVRLDESRVTSLDRSKPVSVVIDSLGADAAQAATQEGTITEVERALDPGSHAFLVKIDLPQNTALTSGMYGRARFAGTVRQTVVVPESAVVRHGQLTSLFVVGHDSRAHMRLVQVGATVDGRVMIDAGLDAGESVVVQPGESLVDGSPVRPVVRSARVESAAAGEVRR